MKDKKMLSRPESFAILVDGKMNPAIHHPTWYHLSGTLNREDLQAAVDKGRLLVTPLLSEFATANFSLKCEKALWKISTRSRHMQPNILAVTLKTFDDLLPDTPITGYRFVFDFSVPIENESATSYLRNYFRNTLLLEGGEESAIRVSYTRVCPAKRHQVEFRSVSHPSEAIFIRHSFLYAIREEKVFTLRRTSMPDDYESDYEESVTQVEQFALRFPRKETKRAPSSPSSTSN